MHRTELIATLQRATEEVVRPLISPNEPVALLDFPSYANVGDSAIWLGELSWLRRWQKVPVYTCDILTYNPLTLARRIGRGTILLSGGGNFGDLYEHHQRFRESVVAAFPHNRIVQLAQTVCFRSQGALARARAVFNAHPDVIILVRDQRSLDVVSNSFQARAALCPDLAFGLGALTRAPARRSGEIRLLRRDLESAAPGVSEDGSVDWGESDPAGVAAWLNSRLRYLYGRHPRALIAGLLARLYARLAQDRLQRGLQLLTTGETVLTDRLHAHILCVLLGIPHVLRADRFGKVSDFVNTWTRDCELVQVEQPA
jgi:exopolysaccharide biosynthesis predicted pyruvyltransferase EpsI